jgi:F-box-like
MQLQGDELGWTSQGCVVIFSLTLVVETAVTIEDLPNEVLFNIFEKLQDNKPTLYKCLFVSKRWYNLSIHHVWAELEFTGDKNSIQLLQHIIPDELSLRFAFARDPNCGRVRSLFLAMNVGNERVDTRDRCCEISRQILKYTELLKECIVLRTLRMNLYPFVPQNANPVFWSQLEPSNALLIKLVELAATKEYGNLFLDIGHKRWEYEDGLRDTAAAEKYIKILGGKITRLHILETATNVWSWFTMTPNLRRLDFENLGKAGEEVLTNFWEVLSPLPLEELNFTQIDFPQSSKFHTWPHLRSLRLNQFNDVEATVSIVLSSFPNLRTLAFNNPTCNIPRPVPLKSIICTSLRTLTFTHCHPQKGILQLIAQKCPHLQSVMPPSNTSDTDILALIDSCPYLHTLLIDNCTDLTAIAIRHLPRAPRLRSLKYNFEHLLFLDEDCILALAENCPDLHSRGFRVASLGRKDEKVQRNWMRDRIPGCARYKRWLLRFAEWRGFSPFLDIHIDVDEIRKEIERERYGRKGSVHQV